MHSLTLAIINFNRISFQKQAVEQYLYQVTPEAKERLDASYERALQYLDQQVKIVHSSFIVGGA